MGVNSQRWSMALLLLLLVAVICTQWSFPLASAQGIGDEGEDEEGAPPSAFVFPNPTASPQGGPSPPVTVDQNNQDTEPTPTAAPSAFVPEWSGCVDFANPDAKVKIGDPTTICLVVANGLNWTEPVEYLRLNFRPKADEYSRFHVPQSFRQLVIEASGNSLLTDVFDGRNVSVHVASQQALSFQRKFYDGFGKVYPHLTAVIDVEDGDVVGISWDSACLFCSKSECEENTFNFQGVSGEDADFAQPTEGCMIEESECIDLHNDGGTDCDLILYVVWTGTDADGKAFLSSAYRFSAFPNQDLSDRLTQNLPDAPEIDNPFTGTDNSN